MKKILTTKQPEYLYRRISKEERIHNYNLRPREDEGSLELPKIKGNIAYNSFIHRGTREYNQLPRDIKVLPLKPFKKQLKEWIKTKVSIQWETRPINKRNKTPKTACI